MSTHPRGRKKKRSRGSILLLSIFFLIILFSLAVTFFRVIPAEFHSSTQARRMVQAQYAGDAGVREAVGWLKAQNVVDDNALTAFTNAHDDNTVAAQKVDDDWSYTVSIEVNDPILKVYDVVSIAYYQDKPVREIRTTVKNETFAKYALFYDTWGSDFLFTMGANSIQGPFHTNDYFHLAAPDSGFWTDGKAPFVNGAKAEMTFADEMPSSMNLMEGGDGNMYYGGNYGSANAGMVPFTEEGTPIDSRYNKMISGGREKMNKVDHVNFPEAVTELRDAAWGGTPPATADLNTLKASKGPLLVNTDAGANTPGKVKGGMLYASNAKSVRLEITLGNGNHQKTKITDATDTVIVGGGTTTYKYDEDVYRALFPQPDKVTTSTPCIQSHTETQPVYGSVNQPKTVTSAHPSCGTEVVFIPGSGGVSTPITVNKVCAHKEDNWVTVQTGTKQVTVCDKYGPTVTTVTPQPAIYKDVASDYPGAQKYKTVTKTTTDPNYPGAYGATTGNATIPTVNSVVEVNDSAFKIPFYSGMKINGVVITDPNDSRLTVTDGNTVHIKNDYSANGKNYAEYTVMEGRINGVTFSDGNLLDVQGTSKGSKHADANGENVQYRGRLIATDIQSMKNLEISGNILQYYDGSLKNAKGVAMKNANNQLIPGNASPNADHILGLVAHDITLKQNTGTKSSTFNMARNADGSVKNDDYSKGLNVYGVLMAGTQLTNGNVDGGFGADSTAMQSNDGLGDFNLFGGIISGNARKTQTGYSSGVSTGFRMNLNYDEIAAMNLENFPTTNNYSVTRYVNIGAGQLGTGFGAFDKE